MKSILTQRIRLRISVVLILLGLLLMGAQVWADGSDDESGPAQKRGRKRKEISSSSAAAAGAGVLDATQRASIFTPGRSTTSRTFYISPASQELSFVIYLIHDHSRLNLRKVDLESRVMNAEGFSTKMAGLRQVADELRRSGTLHRFHRYVGYVSQKKRSDRTTIHRFSEHVRDCNALGRSSKKSERRLYKGLRLNARNSVTTHMTVLAYNIHPSQITAVEAYLIEAFGGLEDLGWNSSSGDIQSMRALLSSRSSSALSSVAASAAASSSSSATSSSSSFTSRLPSVAEERGDLEDDGGDSEDYSDLLGQLVDEDSRESLLDILKGDADDSIGSSESGTESDSDGNLVLSAAVLSSTAASAAAGAAVLSSSPRSSATASAGPSLSTGSLRQVILDLQELRSAEDDLAVEMRMRGVPVPSSPAVMGLGVPSRSRLSDPSETEVKRSLRSALDSMAGHR